MAGCLRAAAGSWERVLSPPTRSLVPEQAQDPLLDVLHGYDALVVLPDGPRADWALTGFKPLGRSPLGHANLDTRTARTNT